MATLSALLATAPLQATQVVDQGRTGRDAVTLQTSPAEACVRSAREPEPHCWPVPPGLRLTAIEPVGAGWVVAGALAEAGRAELYLARRTAAGVELLAPPPGPPAVRTDPVPLVDNDLLVGLAWLEGPSQAERRIRVAALRPDGWEEAAAVAPGPGTQRVALDGTVLPDGSWLLVWTEFDGLDDDTFWSLGGPAGWSLPRRLAADDSLPDVTPAVAPLPSGGAVAAWGSFDGADYRLELSVLEGGSWSSPTTGGGKGVSSVRFVALDGTLYLVHRSVEPAAWVVLRLGADGRPSAVATAPKDRIDPPALVDADGRGVRLEWPAGQAAAATQTVDWLPAGAEPPEFPATPGEEPPLQAPPPESPEGGLFRYMAFGDSITAGLDQHDEQHLGGYPGRLPGYLINRPGSDCTAATCEVANKGKGGEQTGPAITRLAGLLASEPWDILLLMEGTNDIFHSVSNPTIEANLRTMDAMAAAHGVDTLHASIIHFHPGGVHGTTKDADVQNLRSRIQDIAADNFRYFGDPWSRLCPTQACFDQHYGPAPPDPVGHPDASGFEILADEFYDTITSKPAPGPSSPVAPIGTIDEPSPIFVWNKEIPRDGNWYELELSGPVATHRWIQEELLCAPWQCQLSLGIVLPDGAYTWRVRGRNPNGYAPWAERQFTISTAEIFADGFESGDTGAWTLTEP